MKPPLRPRWAPSRFVTAQTEPERSRSAWSEREKRALLAALRAQSASGLPDIQTRPLRERLPRRSEAEIRGFLCRLRGRAAREALCGQYRHCLGQRRRRPAPIEVWLELAAVLSEGLEEAVTAAFGQVFTVAGTEPLSLSLPPPRPSEPRSSQSETPRRSPAPRSIAPSNQSRPLGPPLGALLCQFRCSPAGATPPARGLPAGL
ncbi:snRNA-activating protein complex subunit 2 [Guaruba guarouba]